ncbi:hypothetical protein N7492_001308 [Penicillium capsulatum]|uniref:N-acetyltransferase domain-containing protein n=1 Tax=Penicillium capsulatum TaxID=69766 RepID=A0A9W9ITE9_9EURO|nr:hypothetical protein N7492_001308 [Penicillium capsulatum]KAJ6129633.1 hypothetical protein N7512_002413 [Penicillium capsulatum]
MQGVDASTMNPESLYPDQTIRVSIPERGEGIQTRRLYLRPLEITDAGDIFEYRSQQDVANWLRPSIPHKDVRETEAHILKKQFTTPDASGNLGRQFTYAVIRADDPTHKVVGTVGINALIPAPSIGYGLHPDLWGSGYASEAVAAVVGAWWKLPRVESVSAEPEKLFAACDKRNLRSMRVLQKCGFVIYEEKVLDGDTMAALCVLSRPRG